MGGGPVLWLAAAVVAVSGASDHWSRPATPERRSGDWVPLSCATPNCRPLDQGAQSSDSLPSVLTPPPRVEGARLLPPPPPDGLFQTAASGYLQAFTQQQPPRKPLQFLQETSQSGDRPQAQYLKSQGPPEAQFLREPSAEFTPPQLQSAPFDQRFVPDQPYLNQPIFLGPQFLAAPFFPQTSVPPQNVQPIGPAQVQPQAPIAPNVPGQNFQVSGDRPVFLQQITASGAQLPPSAPQQIPQPLSPEQQYSLSGNGSQASEEEKDEVQLLYVPVETLNKARNMGRPKSIAQAPPQQQVVAATETNSFSSPSDNYEFSTVRSNLEEQAGLGEQSQIAKHQYNTNLNSQFQQQLPPEDQEKYNTQTYTVAQQFNVQPQNGQFNQAPLENAANFKSKPTKQQYNFKLNNQYQQQFSQEQANFQQPSQFKRLPELNTEKGVLAGEQRVQQQNIGQNLPQQIQPHFNAQAINQQFINGQIAGRFQQVANAQQQRFQEQLIPVQQQHFQEQLIPVQQQRFQEQQIPVEQQQIQQQTTPVGQQQFQQQTIPVEQGRFQQQGAPVTQQIFQTQTVPSEQQRFQQTLLDQRLQGQNTRVPQNQLNQGELPNQESQQQQQINQQNFNTGTTVKDQPYINQPIEFNQKVSPKEPVQISSEQFSSEQSDSQQQSKEEEVNKQTAAPVTQTRRPDTYTPQVKKQRFRNPQESTRNVDQQNNQFNRKFPQDYRQQPSVDTSEKLIDPLEQAYNLKRQQEKTWAQDQKLFNQQDVSDIRQANNFQSGHQQESSLANPSTTQPPPQTTLAPNQPPLSVYMETTEDTKVNDVLRLLKNAKTIQVLDTVGPDSPQVFVGPSNLKAPTGYIKFELPYLNSIENNNRVERKVDKLPFFVAPLNFNPPPGYSKIPFPAPHIGSVVVSNVTILKTALHEKPYEDHQIQVSTTERFKDQYTLPAEIPPISPQLPSLINSLQDEIYSGSTTNLPTNTPDATTQTYTTPSYRGRGSTRGSNRGTVSSVSPSRRPQSRTRRPYDGQPYSRRRTTTTTTTEPSTEAFVQQYTAQPEQVALNTDAYNVQSTAVPINGQDVSLGNNQNLGQENVPAYYNEQFLSNNYNQFSPQTQQMNGGDHTTHISGVESIEGLKQYHQVEDSTQNFARDSGIQTTGVPALARPENPHNDQTFTSQRTGSARRDPTRQHQRFRGRQRLTTTTTTTEQYEVPSQQEPQINPQQTLRLHQQPDLGLDYQNTPRRVNLDNHRLVENTHFTASIPKFNTPTERSDAVFQTTERQYIAQNGELFANQNVNNGNKQESPQPQFTPASQFPSANAEQGLLVQDQAHENINSNLGQTENHNKKPKNQFEYESQDQQSTPSPNNQFQQDSAQAFDHTADPQLQSYFHQVNAEHIDQAGNIQAQQNYFNQQNKQIPESQSTLQQEQSNAQKEYNDKQLYQYSQQEQSESLPNQEQHFTQNIQNAAIPQIGPQQIPIQTPGQPDSLLQTEEEAKVPQFNQQRLVKYNRQQNIVQTNPSSINEQQNNYQQESVQQNLGDSQTGEVSSTEPATTRASLVRVRGRVRGRQRASSRNHQPTTTEEPNYPTTYLNQQRTNQEKDDGQQDFAARKRVNYNRQSARNTYREDQNIPDSNYANTEKQPTSERISVSSDITSTTEAPTTIKGRRYQHILNRNKVRRTRPSNSPSTAGSSGTTRFLTPTASPPVTRLPVTRGRIRKPVSTTTTTTEYPEVSKKWNEQDNFAPSAGSNEILEPLYQTKDKTKEQPSYGFLRPPVIPPKTVPKEVPPPQNQDDYWNQGVTIQQSTSFDFKADPAEVTPPSFVSNDQNDGDSPIWNGQIELQDGQFYDVFNQQHQPSKHADQTPFSSDQQKIVYKDLKNRQSIGKENQYTEKAYEIRSPSAELEEDGTGREKVYPVYREIIRPAESIKEEAQSQASEDSYQAEQKGYEKNGHEHSDQGSKSFPQDEIFPEGEREVKEGALKRKISATNAGKKGLRRRGQWVRVRVRKPQDSLETAESQNLAVHSENAIQAVTKAVGEKVSWTPEQVSTTTTETPQTTTETPTASEPAETINFEDALKDMLKEFITNSDENKDEEGTEANTMIPGDETNTSAMEEEKSESEPKVNEQQEKQNSQEDDVIRQDEEQDDVKQEAIGKTPIAEVSTETLTQEPTTVFQANENFETTIEPEITTNKNDQVYNSHHSRVLGTSTTTEISLETEICYRGRCVKTKKLDSDGDLLTME